MGLFFAIAAAFIGTSKDIVSKLLSSKVSGTASAFASFLFALPFYIAALPILWLLGYEDFVITPYFIALAFLRGLIDAAAEWFKMNSYTYADISVANTFMALSPLFVLVFSPVITGDNISLTGYAAIFIIVLGTLLLGYRPKKVESESQLKGILFAFAASVAFALNMCVDKLAVQEASAVMSGFMMTLFAALYFIPAFVRNAQNRKMLKDQFKTFSIRGFIEFVYMSVKLSALQYLPVQYVMGINKSSVLLSVVGGKIFFQEKEFTRRFLCSSLILVGVVMIIFELT